MNKQSLQAFLAVAETESFSEAAEQLHLTQPAVSKRISLLEDQLGNSLFDRIGRQVSLTEAGRTLLPKAEEILFSIRDTENLIRDLSGEVSGKLRLGTSHHIGLHRLPPILKKFTQQYPNVELDISFMDSEKAYEAIAQGKLEIAVVTLSPDKHEHIIEKTNWADPLSIVVAKDHILAKEKTISLKTLSKQNVILPGLNTYTGQIVKRLFDQEKLSLQVSMSTNYLETIKMLVSIGLGWSVLPHSMVDKELAAIPLQKNKIERKLGTIYHHNRALSNAAQAFINNLF